MTGLLIYLFTGCGLAGLVPRPDDRDGWAGTRLFVGFSLAPLALFILHPVAGVSWRTSCFALGALAMAGFARLVWQFIRDPNSRPPVTHPVFLLPILVSMVIVGHGGVSYLPYAGDEFSNWIGAAKQLFAAGSYEAGRAHLINPTYTIGWPFLMAYPMVLLGRFDEGLAAAAPLVMQIAFAGMVFDLLRRAFDEALPEDGGRAMLFAWVVVLLLLAAEATGRLWPYNLLIEPPQIAGYAAILLIVLHAGQPETKNDGVWALVGLLLASQYMIKVTVLSLVPALMLAVLAVAIARGSTWEKCRGTAVRLALILAPIVVVALLWRRLNPEDVCLSSPLSLLRPENLAMLTSDRAGDLAQRFSAAVWSYVASYKAPLTVAGVVGLLLGITSRRLWLVAAVFAAFAVCYFGALYWYHLTCFGEYYFRELNSIQRFTRVVLRLVHGVGLIMLTLWVLDRIRAGRFGAVGRLAAARRTSIVAAVAILCLAAWETVKLDRTIEDLASRKHQTVLANVLLLPKESARIISMIGTRLPKDPTVAVIDTATGLDAFLIAHYYGMGTEFGGGAFAYRVGRSWNFGARPADPAAVRAWEEKVLSTLRQTDLVWPLVLDPPLRRLLASRIDDAACRDSPTAYFLVPSTGDGDRFACIAK